MQAIGWKIVMKLQLEKFKKVMVVTAEWLPSAFLFLVKDYWHSHSLNEISRVDKTTKINYVEL